MKTTNKNTSILFASLAGALLIATTALAADATGTWTWTTPGRNGGPDRVNTLTLNAADSSLTGKLSVPGRDGQPLETPISDGKIEGDSISFDLVREYNGNSSTNKYSGTVAADTITGQIEFNRNGETQSRKWEAKRTTDNK